MLPFITFRQSSLQWGKGDRYLPDWFPLKVAPFTSVKNLMINQNSEELTLNDATDNQSLQMERWSVATEVLGMKII